MATIAKAVRLIALRDMLCSGRYWSVREMAWRLNVSRRTIQRDIRDLEGAPIYEPIICTYREGIPEYRRMER